MIQQITETKDEKTHTWWVIPNTQVRHGLYEIRSKAGALVYTCTYENGFKTGVETTRHSCGRISHTRNYEKGRKHGLDIKYSYHYGIDTITSWKHDVEHGVRMQFSCGKLYHIINIVDGKRHGAELSWDATGKPALVIGWKHDKLHGPYDDHTTPRVVKCEYVDGNIHGPYTETIAGTGALVKRVYYDHGEKVGPEEFWHYKHGHHLWCCTYVLHEGKGVMHGLAQSWHDNGNLHVSSTYMYGKEHGVRTVRGYHNAQIVSQYHYANGLQHGPEIFRGITTSTWKHGKKDGLEFHSRGITTWKEGVKHGVQIELRDNGKLSNAGVYENDQRVGGTISRPGDEWVAVTYKAGKQHGQSVSYGEDGLISQIVQYVNGEPHGVQIKYHRNVDIVQRIWWNNGKYVREAVAPMCR